MAAPPDESGRLCGGRWSAVADSTPTVLGSGSASIRLAHIGGNAAVILVLCHRLCLSEPTIPAVCLVLSSRGEQGFEGVRPWSALIPIESSRSKSFDSPLDVTRPPVSVAPARDEEASD
jgi:hypothetical protein